MRALRRRRPALTSAGAAPSGLIAAGVLRHPLRAALLEPHNNLLYRWFVGLSPDDPIWHPTTFTKYRERLLNDQVMGRFLEKLMSAPEVKPLFSDEHFSVDGTQRLQAQQQDCPVSTT